MSSIGAVSGAAGALASTPAPAGLDAQKAQVEKQLADCVNCASAATPEGKAKIEQLSARLSAVEARMEAVAQARAEASNADSGASASASTREAAAGLPATLASHVDVYA